MDLTFKKVSDLIQAFNSNESSFNNNLGEKDRALIKAKENTLKSEYENNYILTNRIESKTRKTKELEEVVLNKLPAEYKNFEYLFKKELELNYRIKQDSQNLKEEDYTANLKNQLRVYKEISMISISKTDKGYLKVHFRNIDEDNREVYIVLQVLNEYRVIEIYPTLNIRHLEDELMTNKNFTVFLTKLANELIKYFNR
jgi:hypothetical protein